MKYKTVAIVLGVVLVAMIALFGNLFRVREVSVEYVGASPTEADPADVYSVCAIETNGSILNLNENEIRERVAAAYPDRLITVIDVVREFPDTVKVYVEEHAPMCAVPLRDGTGYAIADRDFALDRKAREADLDKNSLIMIIGLTVGNSYDTADFATLRNVFLALESEGIPAAAQPRFLASIAFEGDKIKLNTRTGDTLTIDRSPVENIGDRVSAAYREYAANL